MNITKSRLALIYILLVFPCIFSSALIFPAFFAPFRVPLYLVSIIVSIPFLYKAPTQLKQTVALLVSLLLFAAILSGFWVNERQFAINLRQWLAYSSIFMCGVMGALVARLVESSVARFGEQLLVLFSLLFLYGIYTYYAQEYDLIEFLYFLRPSPALIEDEIYLQAFAGWATPIRAYSVWYEPSFSAIILACSLPLLYFPAKPWVKFGFVIFAVPYIYLTFSRSAWLVGIFFIVGHLSGLFKFKSNRIALFAMAMTLGVVAVVLQVLFSNSHEEASALIRITSIVSGMLEWLDNPLFGTGQAELVKPIDFLDGANFIHATIPAMLHWYGLIGLLIVLIPYWHLAGGGSGGRNKASTSFVYLSVIAITVGGAIMMMSIFWFFWGFYMCANQNWDERV